MLALDDAITSLDVRQSKLDQHEILLIKLVRILQAYELTTERDILDEIGSGKELSIVIRPHDDFITIETRLTDA